MSQLLFSPRQRLLTECARLRQKLLLIDQQTDDQLGSKTHGQAESLEFELQQREAEVIAIDVQCARSSQVFCGRPSMYASGRLARPTWSASQTLQPLLRMSSWPCSNSVSGFPFEPRPPPPQAHAPQPPPALMPQPPSQQPSDRAQRRLSLPAVGRAQAHRGLPSPDQAYGSASDFDSERSYQDGEPHFGSVHEAQFTEYLPNYAGEDRSASPTGSSCARTPQNRYQQLLARFVYPPGSDGALPGEDSASPGAGSPQFPCQGRVDSDPTETRRSSLAQGAQRIGPSRRRSTDRAGILSVSFSPRREKALKLHDCAPGTPHPVAGVELSDSERSSNTPVSVTACHSPKHLVSFLDFGLSGSECSRRGKGSSGGSSPELPHPDVVRRKEKKFDRFLPVPDRHSRSSRRRRRFRRSSCTGVGGVIPANLKVTTGGLVEFDDCSEG